MKINNKVIMRSLPMVAAVLGKQYGVKVEVGGTAAYTDGSTIHLPSIDLEKQPDMLNLIRSYTDHESAHIRHTDFSYLKSQNLSPLAMSLFNIIEDWRVENELVKQFPGCRYNFDWLIKHHFAGDIKVTDQPEEVINYILYCIRSWDVPEVTPNRDNVAAIVEKQFPGLISKLNTIINICQRKCQSTVDAVYFAKRIVELLKALSEEHTKHQQKQSKKKVQGDYTGASKNEEKQENKRAIYSSSIKKMINNPSGRVLKDMERMMQNQLNQSAQNSAVRDTVAVEGTKHTIALRKGDIDYVKRSSMALHTRLQSLLQSSTLKLRRPARHGRLNASRLYKIDTDSKLFLRNEQSIGINTSIHILFDTSGSMRRRIELASQSCFAIAESLSKINGVSVAVSSFPANADENKAALGNIYPTVYPLLKHGEKVHTNFSMKATGTTPMGASIWWAMQQDMMREESRKIILIITDGQPDEMQNTVNAINKGRELGFEFYGIGIINPTIERILGKNSELINSIDELSPKLFKLLQNALLEKRK